MLLATERVEDRAAARDALDQAAALVKATGARVHLPFVHLERAKLAADDAGRGRELREAHRLFVEIGAPLRAAQVARELAT